MPEKNRAVFLDRDGVINQTVFRRGAERAPHDLSEWRFMPGIHEVARSLRARGYVLVVCTNQPDVSRGWQSREQVDVFHDLIVRELPIERVYACFHDTSHDCACRKPKPGMLLEAARDYNIDFARSFMVGDRSGDVEAGQAAGCTAIHMRHADKEAVAFADHEIRELTALLELIR